MHILSNNHPFKISISGQVASNFYIINFINFVVSYQFYEKHGLPLNRHISILTYANNQKLLLFQLMHTIIKVT